MAITIGGYTVNTGHDVETNTLAARITNRPYDVVAANEERGSYSLGMDNGSSVLAAAARTDVDLFQFRWTDANTVCVLRSFKVNYGTVIAYVAGQFKLALFFAAAFTAAGTGGTTATITGRNLRKRTSFATTVLAEARIGTTGVLTAGTYALDTQPISIIASAAPTVIGPIFVGQDMIPMVNRDTSDEHSFVLGFNEGLVLRMSCPATGTAYYGVQLEWFEMPANEFFG